MYLKSLELHGFKSFPNRTVLSFERGATVIVGPNGSGKSNISDAMRWVLGELSSRNIRGTRMEDVIFGGTDDRRPMGFAEVSVTFDNSDPDHRLDSEFDEVVVTRRYYRTGESEYLINRQPRRLRDIYELFMNTGVGREGYSIIGQGKIAEIISKKSDERRNIFEEAAGISKYRHRKEESERKLKQTQDNLDRVRDILLELEARVGPLEKEAEKARKGLALYEEKKVEIEKKEGRLMYFVPDGTTLCGCYECEDCGMRFLSLTVGPSMICPYCGEEVDMELGPDDEMVQATETAKLMQVVRDEDVEKWDALLSLALTGGENDWI